MALLTPAKIKNLRQRREKLLHELSSLHGVIRGTYLERFSTCARRNCACHNSSERRHGPRNYVVVSDSKRQKQHYVPQSQVPAVLKGIAQYRRLLEILAAITRINMELMRSGVLDDRAG